MKREDLQTYLETALSLLPAHIYWKDKNGVFLACNDAQAISAGFSSGQEMIGKTDYEMPWKNDADDIRKTDQEVIQNRKSITKEESSLLANGKKAMFLSQKVPLANKQGQILGVLGISIDVTDRKRVEELQLENELQRIKAQEQLKFRKLVNQVANDVQSPLTILLILIQQCMGRTKDEVLETIESLAAVTPISLYWFDKNGILLGANKQDAKYIGGTYIGKTPYDYFPFEIADNLIKNNNSVMRERKILSYEEQIKDGTAGEIKYFTTFKAPLCDNTENVIGVLGTAVDVTAEKNAERLKIEAEAQKIKLEEQLKFKRLVDQAAKDTKSNLAILLVLVQQCSGLSEKEVFETIESLADIVPICLYWMDKNNKLLGANKLDVETVGATSVIDFIGKTPYDYFPFEIADNTVKHNNLVMQTGKILSQEEPSKDITTGKDKYYNVFKAPLYDNKENIIGILCTVVDITAEKNAEYLKTELYKAQLENEIQKAGILEQEKFRVIANQLAHDIRSPLTSLQMIVTSSCKNLPEKERLALHDVAQSITDVANNLLNTDR